MIVTGKVHYRSTEAERQQEKYHDTSGIITDEMLFEQLVGGNSFAVGSKCLAYILPLDIDSGGLAAIQTLIDECRRRGLWAFGQCTPRPGAAEEEQHGYIFVPFADLVNVARIQRLGDELLQAVAARGWKIENRAHGADTRLPLTYHQVNRTWGELVLLEERIPIDPHPPAVMQRLFDRYQENPIDLLPPPPETKQRAPRSLTESGVDIARFNETYELTSLLEYYGAKRVGKGLYLCPFHDDRRASLGVYVRNGHTQSRVFIAMTLSWQQRLTSLLLSLQSRNNVWPSQRPQAVSCA
jgi:hypothetical protein